MWCVAEGVDERKGRGVPARDFLPNVFAYLLASAPQLTQRDTWERWLLLFVVTSYHAVNRHVYHECAGGCRCE